MTALEALRALVGAIERHYTFKGMGRTGHAMPGEIYTEYAAAKEVLARPEPEVVMYQCVGKCGHLFGDAPGPRKILVMPEQAARGQTSNAGQNPMGGRQCPSVSSRD